MTGEAGDTVSEGVAPFPVVLRTPDILNPFQADGAWIYPKSLVRATLTAEAATESPQSDIIKLSVCAGDRIIRDFQFPRLTARGCGAGGRWIVTATTPAQSVSSGGNSPSGWNRATLTRCTCSVWTWILKPNRTGIEKFRPKNAKISPEFA